MVEATTFFGSWEVVGVGGVDDKGGVGREDGLVLVWGVDVGVDDDDGGGGFFSDTCRFVKCG